MTTITSVPHRRPLVAALVGFAAIATLAVGLWAARDDSRPVSTVQASNAEPLPAKVSAAFADLIHNRADGHGAVTVTYVESQLGPASSTLNLGGLPAVDQTTPVWVVFARGRFTFGYAPRGATPVPGNVIAIIDATGRVYTGGGYGQSIADLARLGSPKTTVVEAG